MHDARVAAFLDGSRWDLFEASIFVGDSKRSACGGQQCAFLVFYNWDDRSGLNVILDRTSHELAFEPEQVPRPMVPASLRQKAGAMALQDPIAAAAAGPGAFVGNVADTVAYGNCARDLCVFVAVLTTAKAIDDPTNGVDVEVNLTRGKVDLVMHEGKILFDARWD